MIKILLTIILGLSFVSVAQESPTPDNSSTNAAPITEKNASDFSGDPAYSKTAGVGKAQGKTEADLNPKDKSACTNCPQDTKNRLTSNKGKYNKATKANKNSSPSKTADQNQ